MSELDKLRDFYSSKNSNATDESLKTAYPDWIINQKQMALYDAVEIEFANCKEVIANLSRSTIDHVKKKEIKVVGSKVCDISEVGRKDLTPEKQPEITEKIKRCNDYLQMLYKEKKAAIKADTSKRKPELLNENRELKKQLKSEHDNALINYFKDFENSEWAQSLDSVYEKLKEANAKIMTLEEENANLRARNKEIESVIDKYLSKLDRAEKLRLVKNNDYSN